MVSSLSFKRAVASSVLTLTLAAPVLAAPPVAPDYKAEYESQHGLEMIGVKAAWDKGFTGKGVLVGVTDTGLEIGAGLHPDLVNSYSGISFDGFGVGMTDLHGHGTHVAGIIAAARDGIGMVGVAYDSKIVPIRFLTGTAGDPTAPTEDILNFGIDNGVRIFNASWGADGDHTDIGPRLTDDDTPESRAFRRLVSSDSVIVFATGNDLDKGFTEPSINAALPYYFPELQPAWLAVTSVNRAGDQAWYAQGCGVAALWCVAAPGGDTTDRPEDGIYSAWKGKTYLHEQGTSMAAPHVTGALAIARQMYPNARMQDLSQLVLNTATDIGEKGIDPTFGWGLLNITNMVATQSAEAGSIYAQAGWAQSATLDRVIDQVSGRRAVTEKDGTPFWVTPFGAFGGLSSGNPDFAGTYTTTGVVAGLDLYSDKQWRAGITLGTSGHGFSSDTGNSASDFGLHGGGYLSYDNSQVFADLVIGGSGFWGQTTRNTAPGLTGTVLGGSLGNVGDHSDFALWGDLRGGAHVDLNSVSLSPYAFARAVSQNLSGVVETGNNALVLDVVSATHRRLEVGIGFEIAAAPIALEAYSLTPSLDLAYGRVIGDDYARDFALLGTSFQTATDTPGPDVLHLGAALTLTSLTGPLDAKFAYQGDYRAGASTHTVSAKISGQF
ncbi:S8 family serine peptidase [Devosia sp. 2618]|uniref:S8 family peptidase n=1 Tax=Devosia sp. 2618 TaxID=3156454 RepID=UPI00339243E5